MKFRALTVLLLIITGIAVDSCKKDPGEGGSSSITGYIHVTDYNSEFTVIKGEYAGADEDVYLICGDDISYTDRIRSGPDGRFEFRYLRKGNYTVYVYSDTLSLAGKVAVFKSVTITRNHQTVDADTIRIKK